MTSEEEQLKLREIVCETGRSQIFTRREKDIRRGNLKTNRHFKQHKDEHDEKTLRTNTNKHCTW